ncbi:MAG: ribonuclease HII [Asgard group archaeon]|nr:ribonuclease HII [Asgard group archaeon]
MTKIVVGADEAGRGLIIGPMTIGACAIDDEIESIFWEVGIKDSKKYTTIKKIDAHVNVIKKQAIAYSVIILQADILNNFNKNGMTMDEAEAYAFFRALEEITQKVDNISEYQVDNFQAVNKLKSLMKDNDTTKKIKLITSPRAESKYISVGAASLLAKQKATQELDKIRDKFGDFGSGSTSDKKTIRWLTEYYDKNRSWPTKIVRTYWKTVTNIEKKF